MAMSKSAKYMALSIMACFSFSCVNDSDNSEDSEIGKNSSSVSLPSSSIDYISSETALSSSLSGSSSSSQTGQCVDTGKKGYLRADFANVCLNTDSVRPHLWSGGIVLHDVDANIDYILTRDGDSGDGDLSNPGQYDASLYPYNLLFYAHRLNDTSSCEHGTSCTDFYGVYGNWNIESYGTIYKGSGLFSKFVDGHQENCWVDEECVFIENATLEVRWDFQ